MRKNYFFRYNYIRYVEFKKINTFTNRHRDMISCLNHLTKKIKKKYRQKMKKSISIRKYQWFPKNHPNR